MVSNNSEIILPYGVSHDLYSIAHKIEYFILAYLLNHVKIKELTKFEELKSMTL